MLIAPDKGSESATESKPGNFDVALVVVHGMGNAYKSQILLEWAEPILERMDWLARDRVIGADDGHGVTIHDSDLSGDVPMVTATVRVPEAPRSARRRSRGAPDAATSAAPIETVERKVAILEARWSESFVPMTRAQVFRWAVPFLWRAIIRTLDLFRGTMVLLPVAHARASPPRAARSSCCCHAGSNLVDRHDPCRDQRHRVHRDVGVPRARRRRADADPPAAQPAPAHPVVQGHRAGRHRRARRVDRRCRVVEGTSGAGIRDAPRRARRPRPCQGTRRRRRRAPVRPLAGRRGLDVHALRGARTERRSTCAGSRPSAPRWCCSAARAGRGGKDTYTPVDTWIDQERGGGDGGSGRLGEPLGDLGPVLGWADRRHPGGARKRWRDAYFPVGRHVALRSRGARRAQHEPAVPRPLACTSRTPCRSSSRPRATCSDPTSRASRVPWTTSATALVVIDKKSLGTQHDRRGRHRRDPPGAARRHPRSSRGLVTWVATAIGSVIGFFTAADVQQSAPPRPDRSPSCSTRRGSSRRSAGSSPRRCCSRCSIWLNQLMQKQTERSIVWDRCPLDVRTWLVLTRHPARALRGRRRGRRVVRDRRLEHAAARHPVARRQRDRAPGRRRVRDPRAPVRAGPGDRAGARRASTATRRCWRRAIRCGSARRSRATSIATSSRTRREQLEPDGRWATWWAKHFHDWRPSEAGPVDPASATRV